MTKILKPYITFNLIANNASKSLENWKFWILNLFRISCFVFSVFPGQELNNQYNFNYLRMQL